MKNTFLRKGIGKQTGGVTPCSEYRSDENAIYQKRAGRNPSVVYAHDKPIDRLYWDNRYLFYFLSDHCIYRFLSRIAK